MRLLTSRNSAKSEYPRLPYLDADPHYKLDQDLMAAKKARKKRRRKKPRKSPKKGLSFWHFMPLGAGQFYNNSPVMGGLFALAQTGGLGFMFLSYMNANTRVGETNTYIDERNAEFDTLITNSSKQAHQDETNARVADMDAESNAMVQQANIGLAIALLAYAGSVTEAILNPPSESKQKRTKKKKYRRKKRKRAVLDQEDSGQVLADISGSHWEDWEGRNYQDELRWNLMPLYGKHSESGKPGLGVTIHYKF